MSYNVVFGRRVEILPNDLPQTDHDLDNLNPRFEASHGRGLDFFGGQTFQTGWASQSVELSVSMIILPRIMVFFIGVAHKNVGRVARRNALKFMFRVTH